MVYIYHPIPSYILSFRNFVKVLVSAYLGLDMVGVFKKGWRVVISLYYNEINRKGVGFDILIKI